MSFGLSEDEAKYYVFISLMGPIPISNLVRRFDTNRVRIYRVLEKLEERGFIGKIIGRPVRYIAKPIDETTHEAIEDLSKKLSDLEALQEEIIVQWNKIAQGVEPQSEEPRFRMHQGRQQIYDQLIQICGRAEEEILFITTEKDMHRLALFGFDEYLKPLIKKGIHLKLLTQVESVDFEEIGNYYNFVQIRHVPLPSPVRLLILDNSEILVTVSMDDSMNMNTQNDTSLWTNSESFITVLRVFYDALWKLATDAPSVLNAMKTGDTIQEIITLRTSEQIQNKFIQMVRDCNQSIDLSMNDLHQYPGLIEVLNQVTQEIEKSRIITQLDLGSINQFIELSEKFQIKHITAPSTMDILIVDEKEVLLHLPSWEKNDQSIWSNLTSYVETIQYTFEDYWGRGEDVNEVISRLGSEKKGLELLQRIQHNLERSRCETQSPGSLMGESGKNHVFSLVATRKGFSDRIGLDIMQKDNPLGQIAQIGAKKVDLKNTAFGLICEKAQREEVKEFAKLYRIKLITEDELDEYTREILKVH